MGAAPGRDAARRIGSADTTGQREESSVGSGGIVVVESAPGWAAGARRVLERQGFDAHVARSIPAVLPLVRSVPARVALCDDDAPGGGAPALLALLAAEPARPRVVLVCPAAAGDRVARAFRGGADDVLLDPFTCAQLVAAVDAAGAQRARGTAPVPAGPRVLFEPAPAPAGEVARRPSLSRIANWPRIVEILRRAVKGRRGWLLLDGADVRVPVALGALTAHQGRGYSGALALELARVGAPGFDDVPWHAEAGCVVWFTDPDGVFGFRSTIVGGNRGRLVLTQPTDIVRYSRRSTRRLVMPEGLSPTVWLPTSTGPVELTDAVVDLSAEGIALAVPDGLAAPPHSVVRATLRLRAGGRQLPTPLRVRRSRPGPQGMILGGTFHDLTPTVRVQVQRFVEALAERARRLDPVTCADDLPDLTLAEMRLVP